jgi:hypothetical protein
MIKQTQLLVQLLAFCYLALGPFLSFAQHGRWQQKVKYSMDIDFDVNKHQYTGKQTLVFTNNSPDTLNRVFYHLYFNAFQPGSMMDVRSRTIEDPDRRVGDRISRLKPNEIGYLRVKSLTMNKKNVEFKEVETILEVRLNEPILPGASVTFDMQFDGQVPLQIRRSGRDSEEGIAYSMAQWYPKMCQYDHQGWHANPYIAREFYGIWGDFDVKISIDSSYVVAGTGYLQNPEQIGHGYLEGGMKLKRPKSPKLTWHFSAPNVHDFVWAADPDYVHVVAKGPDGLKLRFFYQQDSLTKSWDRLPEYTAKAFEIMNKRFGQYPYKEYAVIQGGDGGMEYPMATLITGRRNLQSLVGVTVHELVHSWFQMVLATNESLYGWMDEGFDTYATNIVMKELFKNIPQFAFMPEHYSSYASYISLALSGDEEPLSTHADHFKSNRAYSIAAYSKGAVFLHQLSYIIGQENFEKGMLRYYHTWKFRHPTPNDFIRVMEKVADMELDWYKEYFVYTTKQVDYGLTSVVSNENQTFVKVQRIGDMIMPIDIEVEYTDGRKELFYMPLQIMRGIKPQEDTKMKRTVLESWPWVNPSYTLVIPAGSQGIRRIEIDPTQRLADVDRTNNVVVMDELVNKLGPQVK